MMALHSHMDNIFNLIDIQQKTKNTNDNRPNPGQYILNAQFFNELLDRCAQYENTYTLQ